MPMHALKLQATKLRKQGFSYGQINKKLGIAKSTCSLWLKTIKLDKQANSRLKVREFRGKEKALRTIKNRIKNREQEIQTTTERIIHSINVNKNLSKLLCSFLYWAEGEKKREIGLLHKFRSGDDKNLHRPVPIFQC